MNPSSVKSDSRSGEGRIHCAQAIEHVFSGGTSKHGYALAIPAIPHSGASGKGKADPYREEPTGAVGTQLFSSLRVRMDGSVRVHSLGAQKGAHYVCDET